MKLWASVTERLVVLPPAKGRALQCSQPNNTERKRPNTQNSSTYRVRSAKPVNFVIYSELILLLVRPKNGRRATSIINACLRERIAKTVSTSLRKKKKF